MEIKTTQTRNAVTFVPIFKHGQIKAQTLLVMFSRYRLNDTLVFTNLLGWYMR